jgi:hypothetical protein
MTATQNATDEQLAPVGEPKVCDVCGHVLARHDRIAARFCDATLHNALSRACVCSSAPSSRY